MLRILPQHAKVSYKSKGSTKIMNYVYICDDEPEWLKKLEKYVFRYQMQSGWLLEIACSTDSPDVLLQHLTEKGQSYGIYFLDIDFKSSMNGLKLGAKIRELDPDAILIFVTTHDELAIETLHYQLMALDYILKDLPNVEGQIYRVLQCVKDRFSTTQASKQDQLRIKTIGEGYYFLSKNDIYYIETLTGRHKTAIHTANEILSTSCPLSELSAKLGEDFILCHKSYLVNSNYIKQLKQGSREILLDNGETLRCSVRAWSQIIKVFFR